MRRTTPTIVTFVLVVTTLAGCLGSDDAPRDVIESRPVLASEVTITEGNLVKQDEKRAILEWTGTIDGSIPATTTVSFPSDVHTRVWANVVWDRTVAYDAAGDLDLEVRDENGIIRCAEGNRDTPGTIHPNEDCATVLVAQGEGTVASWTVTIRPAQPAIPPIQFTAHIIIEAIDTRGGPADHGLVATSHRLATEIGADVLAAGGNAMDAAAAIQWALNVVEPAMSGLGGGAFIMYYDATTGQVHAYDGRETASLGATSNMFQNPDGSSQEWLVASTRGHAVGVPGTLAVFDLALRDHGTWPLADTMEPARVLAHNGFEVDESLAAWLANPIIQERMRSWVPTMQLFYPQALCPPPDIHEYTPDATCAASTPYQEGALFSNTHLARTFYTIQEEGIEAFYGGSIGAALVTAVEQRGGSMDLNDLKLYEPVARAPLTLDVGDATVYTMPPPSSGVNMLQMLALLAPFDLGAMDLRDPELLHLVLEAQHLGYADRNAWVGDTDHVDVPIKGMLHPEYLDARRALINTNAANPDITAGDPWAYEPGSSGDDDEPQTRPQGTPNTHEGRETTHFVVQDAAGNLASVTSTIETLFGSGIVVPRHGFLLNNELTDFDFQPGGPNEPGPGKRPRSSMSPAIVLQDGAPLLAIGSPGGSTIVATVFTGTLFALTHDLDAWQMMDAPRLYSQALVPDGSDCDFEHFGRLPSATLDALAVRGHHPCDEDLLGNLQVALRQDDGWTAVADWTSRDGSVRSTGPDADDATS